MSMPEVVPSAEAKIREHERQDVFRYLFAEAGSPEAMDYVHDQAVAAAVLARMTGDELQSLREYARWVVTKVKDHDEDDEDDEDDDPADWWKK